MPWPTFFSCWLPLAFTLGILIGTVLRERWRDR